MIEYYVALIARISSGEAKLVLADVLSTSEQLTVWLAVGTPEAMRKLGASRYPTVPQAWQRIDGGQREIVTQAWEARS